MCRWQATLPDTPGIDKMTGQESGHMMGDGAETQGDVINGSMETGDKVQENTIPQSPVKSKPPTVHRSPSSVSILRPPELGDCRCFT